MLSLTGPQEPHESHFISKMKLYEGFSHDKIVFTAKPHLLFLETVI